MATAPTPPYQKIEEGDIITDGEAILRVQHLLGEGHFFAVKNAVVFWFDNLFFPYELLHKRHPRCPSKL